MANKLIIEKKAQTVEEIASKIKDSAGVVFVDYRGLTDEEIAAMRKDTERDRYRVGSKPIWTSKKKLGYTPIFIGKSGAVYVGGVKLEGVRYVDNVQNTHGINTLCVVFDTDRVVDMREKTRTTLLEPDATELREVLERVFR